MRRYIDILFFFLTLLALGSCAKEKTYKYRIGISQCSSDDWREKMNAEILREAMLHPDVQVEIRSADDSNGKQIADIEYFRSNGFDIIIASPNEADAITPKIKEVYESGLPVIIFDRNINGDYYTSRIDVNNRLIGATAGRYAAHLVKPGGRVLEIKGRAGSTPAIDRNRGFGEEAEKAGITILGSGVGNWNPEDATRVTDSLLDIYGTQTDLIFAHNDRMAIAASEAARRRGLDIKVIGIDAAPEIGIRAVADSVIDATFLYPTEGHRILRTAIAILNGEKVDSVISIPVSSAVDKTNADILLVQNESLAEETSKVQALKSQVDEYWDRHSVQTAFFYSLAAILVLTFIILFIMIKAMWQRRRHAEELEEATRSKLVFFTNVSHDLRTPLTLIAEPVEQLAKATNLTPRQQTLMRIADKNVHILRRLINQILDFRKYENGRLNLHLSEVAVGKMLAEWAEAFSGIAARRDIRLKADISLPEGFTMAIDPEKTERIFFNLMSNAFKYTRDNGAITFTCSLTDDGGMLRFSVADTGMGISSEDLSNIFDRFYQVDKVHPNGSGIGLSLAKAFAELHGGGISVESKLGEGSVFTVELPVRHVEAAPESPVIPLITREDIETEIGHIESSPATPGDTRTDDGKPLILVIDDNEDIRRMVSELLDADYDIISAPNGREGLRLAAKYVPDLVVCDVMMPVMDGLECCRLIKEEVSTSHIPVLMLTACSMDEQRVQGYESGADGYVSKPFNTAVLRSRIDSLIANRRRIKELWGNTIAMPAASATPDAAPSGGSRAKLPSNTGSSTDIDSDFYNRFLEIVSAEMGDSDLNVDSLAGKMGLGRSQFYRKIKALTNYSPVELLRNLRLKRARDLLTTTEKTVSEIAYEVGFSTPAYFTRCFREVYSETPTDLRDRLGN